MKDEEIDWINFLEPDAQEYYRKEREKELQQSSDSDE